MRKNVVSAVVVLFAIAAFTAACNNINASSSTSTQKDSSITGGAALGQTIADETQYAKDTFATAEPSVDDETIEGFMVVADTSDNYQQLHTGLFSLHKSFQFTIDTMNRYYNEEKKLIILHENDEDQMYAGEPFPRRGYDPSISIEQMNFFEDREIVSPRKMGLVVGIFENKSEALKVVQRIQSTQPHAHVLPVKMFMGCMH
ncbi:hypothetical protein LX64_03707 [Chitinophaga skermanii]|uniref:Sporulation related protein n=1 Tax=Chitinophaga skermanii TaxID=331697 RepID=A0A327QCY1_9BACT|nr:hypothetical protein [Chitinophaga skermanii]RAJ01492.1 hypothetical protein LX64_03707 [Chitinophaga skermanii]